MVTFIFGVWLVMVETPYLSYHKIKDNFSSIVLDHSAKV